MSEKNLVKELKAAIRYAKSCNRTERTAVKVAKTLAVDCQVRAVAEWLAK